MKPSYHKMHAKEQKNSVNIGKSEYLFSMADILDYISWRGDLPFSASPFNEIDSLILCQISYLNFGGLLKDNDFKERKSLSQLAYEFNSSPDFSARCETGVLINRLTVKLLFDAASSVRFGGIETTGYVSIIDKQKEEQFSAVTYLIPDKTAFVSFRGTDDTIVGWKEDFNLAVMDEVPAQTDAKKYLEQAAAAIERPFRIGGHSKGGNLAIYAAAHSCDQTKLRIIEIFNNDGPGFPDSKLKAGCFHEIIPLIRSFYPQLSIIGMLFNYAGKYSIVKSSNKGLMQHDPFSWNLKGNSFELIGEFDKASSFFHSTFNSWINGLEKSQRELFVETLFQIIRATDAETNSQIEKNILQNSVKIITAIYRLDPELRNTFCSLIIMLFKAAHKNLPELNELFEKNSLH